MSGFGAIEQVRADLKKLEAHLEHTQVHFAQVCEQQAAHVKEHLDRELQDVRGHLRTLRERLDEHHSTALTPEDGLLAHAALSEIRDVILNRRDDVPAERVLRYIRKRIIERTWDEILDSER